ncbi:MAG: hypothetical protein ABEK59_06370 [Halobacteria archaeon]
MNRWGPVKELSFSGARSVSDIKPHEIICGILATLGGAGNALLFILIGPGFSSYDYWILEYLVPFMALGLIFPLLVVAFTNTYAKVFITLFTSHSRFLSRLFSPIIRTFGLAALTAMFAIMFCMALWFGWVVFALPIIAPGTPFTVPNLNFTMFFASLMFGLSLGGFYGLFVQEIF